MGREKITLICLPVAEPDGRRDDMPARIRTPSRDMLFGSPVFYHCCSAVGHDPRRAGHALLCIK